MSRIRTIKPEFPQSESMGRISREARLLFILLWTICDDAGRARAASRMLASVLYPYDDDAPSLIGGWLDELENEKCIVRYQHEDTTYLEVPNWLKHQKIDRPTPSKIPSPREPSRALSSPRDELASPRAGSGPGREGESPPYSPPPSPTREPSRADGGFAEFYRLFPRKKAPRAAEKAYRAAVKRGASPAIILAALRTQLDDFSARPPDRVPYPATWLNGQQWLNEPDLPLDRAQKPPMTGGF